MAVFISVHSFHVICSFQMSNNNSATIVLSNGNIIPQKAVQYIHFDAAEYTVFVAILCLSALIGVYYGCYRGNQNTVKEYMLGGKDLSVFPVAMSLIVR